MVAQTLGTKQIDSAGPPTSVWSAVDCEWEALALAAVCAACEGDREAVRKSARAAVALARCGFDPLDPRFGTALATLACSIAGDDFSAALEHLNQARSIWCQSGTWIEAMPLPRSARSSVFHMRMEVRHREIYANNRRSEWFCQAEAVTERLENHAVLDPVQPETARFALARWNRESAAPRDAGRKFAAAIHLMLVGV